MFVNGLDVVTPAAIVDLDRLDDNLARWQAHCDRAGLANRPHVKTHKCVEIALRQLELGAVGVTCQTLHEAEVMVRAGIRDVVLPYNVVGERKLRQLSALLSHATVRVSADDAALLPGLASAAAGAGRELGVLVDCDTGLGRTGVTSPEAAVELGRQVAATGGLRFDGLLTYPAPPGAREFLGRAAELLERQGLVPSIVSAGGTPAMWQSPELAPVVLNEEHGYLALAPGERVALGVQVRIVPNHACVVANLFEELIIVRNGQPETRWAVERGR